MKLACDFRYSKAVWAEFTRQRFLNDKGMVDAKYNASVVWPGIKSFFNNTRWVLGNGKTISFWKDA